MKRLGIVLAAPAFVAVGCGGGDGDETATRNTSPAATSASTRSATTAKASRPSPCPTKEEIGAALGSAPTSEAPKTYNGWPSGTCVYKWEDGTSKAGLRTNVEGPRTEAEAKRIHAERRAYQEENMGPGKVYAEVTTINGLGLEAFYTRNRAPRHGLHIRAEVPQYGQVNISLSLSEEIPAPRGWWTRVVSRSSPAIA